MADKPLSLTTSLGFFYKQSLPVLRMFITLFFSNIKTTVQTQIRVDRYTKKFKNIAYVPLHGASRLMDFQNGKGILYVPPRISAKTPIGDAADGATVGVDAMAPVTTHLAAKYSLIQEDHSDSIYTTLVLQALDVMRTGAFTATTGVDGQDVGEFTYGRDASLNLNTYDTSVSGAFAGFGALLKALIPFGIPKGNLIALVGANYMAALEADAEFKAYQNNTQYQIFVQAQAGEPFNGSGVVATICRVKIPGSSYYVTLVSFDESYEDTDGTDKAFLPLNEVVMTSLNTRNSAVFAGVKIANHATRQLEFLAGEVVTDRKLFDEPDDLCLRSQSRGLMIPGNINHFARLIATDLSAT